MVVRNTRGVWAVAAASTHVSPLYGGLLLALVVKRESVIGE